MYVYLVQAEHVCDADVVKFNNENHLQSISYISAISLR